MACFSTAHFFKEKIDNGPLEGCFSNGPLEDCFSNGPLEGCFSNGPLEVAFAMARWRVVFESVDANQGTNQHCKKKPSTGHCVML